MGNPFLHTRHLALRWHETGTHRGFGILQQFEQDIVLLSVSYDDFNTFIGHLPGNGSLGQHPSPSETGFLRLDIVGQVLTRFHFPNHLCALCSWRTIVNAIDVAKDDECLHIHHCRNHS